MSHNLLIYLAVVTVVVASVRAAFAAHSKAPTCKVGFRSTIRRKQLSYARALPVAVCLFQSYELLHVETVTHQRMYRSLGVKILSHTQ